MTARSIWTILLVLLCVWVLFYRLGDPSFYHVRNESRRAQIVREMLQTGDWIIPRLEEETILTKPPLFYWAAAFFSRQHGVTERTARMPSAAAGVCIMLLTLLLGGLLFGREQALTAAIVLLTTNFFMHQARYAELEAVLAVWTTAGVYCFWRGYQSSRAAARWYALMYIAMGCGVMTKGPFALTFPLIPIICFLCVYGEQRLLMRRRFLLPVLLLVLIILPWPLAVMRQYPEFYKLVLWETVVRAATGYVHREAWYYYLAQLPRELFPWLFFLPFALIVALKQRDNTLRQRFVFVLLWLFGNLLFMSLLKSKRDYYLFPITPAAALLIAAAWRPLWERLRAALRTNSRRYEIILCGAGLACAAASAIVGNPCAVNVPAIHFPDVSPFLFFLAVVMLIPWCSRKVLRRLPLRHAVLGAVAIWMLGAHYVYFTLTVPILNTEDSGKNFYRTVAELVPREAPIGFVKGYENYSFTFYAGRPLTTIKEQEDIPEFMSSRERRFLVLTGKTFNRLRPLPWRVVFRSPFAEHASWRGYVLLCNK